jgi:hypothetical protein
MLKLAAICTAALAVAGCAGSAQDESVVLQNDAIDDYIEVAELAEIDQIRIRRELSHKPITEFYILLFDGKEPYLVVFPSRCYTRGELPTKPDVRYDARRLHARHDTYRGCRIAAIYKVTPGQAAELMHIGRSPIN